MSEKPTDWYDIATCDLDKLDDVADYRVHDEGVLLVAMKDGRQFTIRVEQAA